MNKLKYELEVVGNTVYLKFLEVPQAFDKYRDNLTEEISKEFFLQSRSHPELKTATLFLPGRVKARDFDVAGRTFSDEESALKYKNKVDSALRYLNKKLFGSWKISYSCESSILAGSEK